MERIFVGLGSNRGDRQAFLREALEALGDLPGWSIHAVSSFYETEPVGNKNQPYFLNAVAEVHASADPEEIHSLLKATERIVGRTPSEKWGPREIDLDLLYVGECICGGLRLTLPHPELTNRKFVLQPLAEIAPEFIDPVQGRTVLDLLLSCPDTCLVERSAVSISPSAVE